MEVEPAARHPGHVGRPEAAVLRHAQREGIPSPDRLFLADVELEGPQLPCHRGGHAQQVRAGHLGHQLEDGVERPGERVVVGGAEAARAGELEQRVHLRRAHANLHPPRRAELQAVEREALTLGQRGVATGERAAMHAGRERGGLREFVHLRGVTGPCGMYAGGRRPSTGGQAEQEEREEWEGRDTHASR
ncbi:MAG: hypothetical protein IPG81_02480 [Sandaracinaceae bacterium]|nr:hypothetical protein [Sandaracinaceae bacterium]